MPAPTSPTSHDPFGRPLVRREHNGLVMEGVQQADGNFWNCTLPRESREHAEALLRLIQQPEVSQLSLLALVLLLHIHLQPGALSIDELLAVSSSRPTTFRALARLIELGLIETSDHPQDRRRTIYTHSEAGLRLMLRCLGSATMTA
jgi:DNA-binding MarR family transcriptional regulator